MHNLETHEELVDKLARHYTDDNYDVVMRETNLPQGKVDLILDDNFSTSYKLIGATLTGTLDPQHLAQNINRKEEQLAKAEQFYQNRLETDEIFTEVVIGTKADLNTINELFENTLGVFNQQDALNAVSNAGRLANLKNQGYILMDYEVSRTENKEFYELSPELEEITDLLLEYKTYP